MSESPVFIAVVTSQCDPYIMSVCENIGLRHGGTLTIDWRCGKIRMTFLDGSKLETFPLALMRGKKCDEVWMEREASDDDYDNLILPAVIGLSKNIHLFEELDNADSN